MKTALIIFIFTYIVIAVQNLPRIYISRPSGSLLGAVFMVLFGVLSFEEALAAIDFKVVLFILGMMIIVAYLEISGFFEVAENYILRRAKNGLNLLFLLVFSSGLFSALFMNDTMCLMLTPVVLRVTTKAGLNPVPYLIALATSSNIGSVMTIIGNPQNMLIGLYSDITFLKFFMILAPVGIIGLFINFAVIWMIYRKDINKEPIRIARNGIPGKIQKKLMIFSFAAVFMLIVFLSLGYNPPAVAMVCACFLILAGATKPRKVLEEVDWTLLLLFSGLFIVMRGVEKSGITELILGNVRKYTAETEFWNMIQVTITSVISSNIISNVPAVVLISNIFSGLLMSNSFWLTLAMASTLAGNLTVIGSIANIIVFESAKEKVNVGFLEYLKVGLPLTFFTILAGIAVITVIC
ncbi:MAG: anion transporter [bacterium]|nr:anion transporter [bacterium]